MPTLNFMRDINAADPMGKQLDRALEERRADPKPTAEEIRALEKIEAKQRAIADFEKAKDTVMKPAAKPTPPQAAPMQPPWAKPRTVADRDRQSFYDQWLTEQRENPQLDRTRAPWNYKQPQAELYYDFAKPWNEAESRRELQEKLDKAHWDSRRKVAQPLIAGRRPDMILFDDIQPMPVSPGEFAEQEAQRALFLKALDA